MNDNLIKRLLKYKETYRSIGLSDRQVEIGWQNLYQRLPKQENTFFYSYSKYFLSVAICTILVFITAIFSQPGQILYPLKAFGQKAIAVIIRKNEQPDLAKPVEIPETSEKPTDVNSNNTDKTADEKNATDSSNIGGFDVEKIFTSPSPELNN